MKPRRIPSDCGYVWNCAARKIENGRYKTRERLEEMHLATGETRTQLVRDAVYLMWRNWKRRGQREAERRQKASHPNVIDNLPGNRLQS